MSLIEAIDGEAIEGLYALMRCSDGRELVSQKELRSQQIFDWLSEGEGLKRYSIFGLNYDANMWLRDLPHSHLKRLWETNSALWNGWQINWIPAKFFQAKSLTEKRGFIAEESWGFFQTSFIKALEMYNIDCPDVIEWGKQERVDFTRADLDRASEYCLAETRALRDLMGIVRDRSAKVGLKPPSWIGPGSLAAQLLKRGGVQAHHCKDRDMPECRSEFIPNARDAPCYAYFGGRIEATARGRYKKAYAYDLSSAYPHAMLSLPSLTDCRCKYTREFDESKHGIWRVRWDTQRKIAPFPVRQKTEIWYPGIGEGWYHTREVAAAARTFDAEEVQIIEGYELTITVADKPFEFIQDAYCERVHLLREGDMAGQMLKLAMNSCYGKLVQSQARAVNGKPAVPRWRQMWWGGEITAITRARLLDAVALSKQPPLLISTDGLIVEDTIPLLATSVAELGGWEVTEIFDLEVLGPGIYAYSTEDGERHVKSRGFLARSVDFDDLSKVILSNKPYSYDDHRFIGVGAALMRKDMGLWRKWEDGKRVLSVPMDRRNEIDGEFWPVRYFLASEPYRPKGKWFDGDMYEMFDQPRIGE